MGIQFRLGPNDHKPVEDFLSREHVGTDAITHVTAPHFYVTDERTARLNVDLGRTHPAGRGQGQAHPGRDTVSAAALGRLGIDLAAEYAGAGISEVEIRFSPFGGDDEGIRKIRTAFGVLDQFREHDLTVTLGLSGNIGRAALAIGHADAYSVGLGMLEKVNHAQTMARYRKAPDPDKDQAGGAAGGIYLPLLGATVSAEAARQLLSHTGIRTRVGCRIGSCRNSVTGPLDDRRAHYLHSRSSEVAEMLRRPAPWRGAMEIDRLNEAIDCANAS